MGNIGHSQGLAAIVEAFERSAALEALSARFVLAGDGVAGDEVRKTIRTDRVTVTGILGPEPLQRELDRAAVAVVSQCYEGAEFNVPSKLMNFMANGLPVVASVRPESEVARILRESGCGWVTDSRSPDECATVLAEVLQRPEELERRGTAGLEFARRSFVPSLVADRFEAVMQSVTE
jgi:colanic acid biosynthesis glycosyl transferase WcaI